MINYVILKFVEFLYRIKIIIIFWIYIYSKKWMIVVVSIVKNGDVMYVGYFGVYLCVELW